jgi:Cysteine-rich secretory protein family
MENLRQPNPLDDDLPGGWDQLMKSALPISLWLTLALCSSAFAQSVPAAPAEMISNYRLRHGEGRVTPDATLKRIAHEQAAAMASKDVLDHGVLGSFSSRVASSKSERAAENIAFGYDSFPKTLDQWIDSPEHRRNLLMHGASKVGVASAKSATTGRTYWAMVIAGGERSRSRSPSAKRTTSRHDEKACRIQLLGLCLWPFAERRPGTLPPKPELG